MIFVCNNFTTSNWIELIGIAFSLLTSIVAIWISIKTLKQNSLMIEESTRPYVIICGKVINFQDPTFYLVLKNHGNSGATITDIKCDCDLSKYSYSKKHIPFSHFSDTFIAPNQSFICALNKNDLFKNVHKIQFEIRYKSSNKKYCEKFSINLDSFTDLIQPRASTKDKELKIISYAIQDLVEKHL